MIILTEKAANALKKFWPKDAGTACGLKFADTKSRCEEGYSYVLDFVSCRGDHDEVFQSQGIKIYVPSSCMSRLQGSVIDLNENMRSSVNPPFLLKECLNVKNPNAKGLCPCACGDGVGY